MEPIRMFAISACQGTCVRVGCKGLLVDLEPVGAQFCALALSEGDPEALSLFGGGKVPISATDGKLLARVIYRCSDDLIEDPSEKLRGLLAQTKIACLPDLADPSLQ